MIILNFVECHWTLVRRSSTPPTQNAVMLAHDGVLSWFFRRVFLMFHRLEVSAAFTIGNIEPNKPFKNNVSHFGLILAFTLLYQFPVVNTTRRRLK